MFKKTVLASALALAGLSAQAADFYVVVPMPGAQEILANINVSLNTATLPGAVVGIPYAGYDLKPLLSITGDPTYDGSGVTWSVVSSTLPAGLSLRTDGTIGGTPTSAGTGTLVVRASYKGIDGEQSYQVLSLTIGVSLASAAPVEALFGMPYSYDLKPLLSVTGDAGYTGADVTWSVVSSTLPAGLSLRTDGTIGGTPTASGTGSITARATYRGVNGEQTYQIVTLGLTVVLNSATLSQGLVGQAYSYDLKPLLSVTGDPSYSASSVTWSVVSGSLPSGLSLNADGTITGTPTAAANNSVTLRASYRGFNGQQAYQLVALNINVSLATAALPGGVVGVPYVGYDLKTLLSVTGDAAYSSSGVTWSVVSSSLPAGLSLRTDGTIGGTPTTAGTGVLVARASYRGVNGEQTYQIVTLNIAVSLASASPPEAVVGQSYSYDLRNLLTVTGDGSYTGNNVTWSVVSSSLPAGLTLRTDGTIGGTPTASGSGQIVARATYRGVNGEQTYQVVSLGITVALSSATLTEGAVGVAYSYDLKPLLTVTGDAAYTSSAVTWSVVSGTLPAGLTLNSNGTITGTPTTDVTRTLVLRASYKGVNGDQTFQLVTLYLRVNLYAESLPTAAVNLPYPTYDFKSRVEVTGDPNYNVNNVTFSTSDLPTGLSLSSSGLLSGTPTVKTGTKVVNVVASYKGKTGQASFVITVNGQPLEVVKVSAGGSHTCAITPAGGVKCWGNNGNGQLGNNSTTSSLVPVDVSGLTSGVTSVSAGQWHTCAITTSGGTKCWGSNQYGQLGNNSTTQSTVPVDVSGLTSGVASISGGYTHTCAITTSGGAKCWGSNFSGQLGNNSTTHSSVPVDVIGLTSGVANVSTGNSHTCALTTGGGVKCWGVDLNNMYGKIMTPTDVSELTSGVAQVSVGSRTQACVVTTSGGAKCWGSGTIGNSFSFSTSTPVDVPGYTSGVAQISLGFKHICAVTTSGGAKCWGGDIQSPSGVVSGGWSVLPVDVPQLTSGVTTLSAGGDHSCVVTTSGYAKCWGENGGGQIGNNSQSDVWTPVTVEIP